jgi:hypothetical protein
MLTGVYFLINAFQAFLLTVFLIYIGSSSQESIIFNLSPTRLFIVLVTLLAAAGFFFLAVRSLTGWKKLKALEEKFLGSESRLWLAFGISILIICFALIMLTIQRETFGHLKQLILNLEPVLAWLVVFGAQTAFFIAIWYCAYFIGIENKRDIRNSQKELLPLLGLFALFIIIKLAFVTATSFGPTAGGDEMTYFRMADSFYSGTFSPSEANYYQYPPLYPLSLVAAFVFRGWAFEGIKLLNIFFSTSILFPIYFIARRFLDARTSFIAAFLSCLIPFQLVFPRRIVSENLFFPLFLWTMLITFVIPENKKYRLPWDLLNGAMVAILYLTRYITLAALPFFILSWWLKPFDGEKSLFKPNSKKIVHLCLLTAAFFMTFCPWPILGLEAGVPTELMLGFGVTARTTAEQLTFPKLMTWAALYACYFILVAAPVLHLLITSLFQIDLKRWREFSGRWIFQVLAIMAGFYMAVTRHSWRAFYNADIPSSIMGRYLIVFSVLYFVIALTALSQFKPSNFRSKWHFFLFAQLIPFGLAVLAFLAVVKGNIIATDGELLKSLGSVDAFYIEILDGYFFPLLFIIYGITNWFLWKGSTRKALVTLTTGLVIYFTAGLPSYYQNLMEYQTYPWLANQIARLIPQPDPKHLESEQVTVFVAEEIPSRARGEIYEGLYTRGVHRTLFETYSPEAIDAMTTEKGFIIQPIESDLEQYPEDQTFQFYDQKFAIIPVQK